MSFGLYFDFSFPLQLMQFLIALLQGQQHDPNAPQVISDSGTRQWFSQPRPGTDPTTEVLGMRFKLPLSVSEITVGFLRVPAHFELWYQDRSNNWRPVLDETRIPVTLDLSGSDVVNWYTYHTKLYPIVAKALQIRAKRRPDPLLGTTPYVIGISEILARRNVYDRSQGTQAFEDEQDVVGNVISKYVKDWDAPRAIDDNATTFWKSAPQPDPNAVVSYYCNIADKVTGAPRALSRLYIDPVYPGQNLNLYYSSDDTVGVRKISPVTLPPVLDENTNWTAGSGREDISAPAGRGRYQWQMAVGPIMGKDVWFGIEWTPDFEAADGPPANPILLKVTPTAPATGVYTPTIYYDVGAGEFVLELSDGTTSVEYSAALIQAWTLDEPLRLVVGWRYGTTPGPDTVFLTVKNAVGDTIASQTAHPTLPANINLDGTMGFDRFRGLMTATLVKIGSYVGQSALFQSSPSIYVNPDPVIPDINGVIPSTTLDNAVYAADWTSQEHGIGGASDTHYADKEWTPIWKNFVAERGTLVLPQAVSAKYLKLEFTSLTPEPYPIYDSGISVNYKVFPISVQQQSSLGPQVYVQPGGFLGLGDVISINGVRSINFLNPFSILDATRAIFGNTVQPISIQTSPGYVTDTIPQNTGIASASQTYGLELGNAYIYRRTALNPYILAKDQYNTTIKAEGLTAISAFTDVPWSVIEASNPSAIQHNPSPGALPIRGTDWWIFPGQTLKLPAAVMDQLTSGETVTEYHADLTNRVRFTTTSVHRYETKTVTRDKAIAYFAGVREIQPYITTYVTGQDVDSFEFTSYDPSQWTMTNTVQLAEGPVTTNGSPYVIPNARFTENLDHWDKVGVWDGDAKVGHSFSGDSAYTIPDGSVASLTMSSSVPVTPSTTVTVSCWVRYQDIVAGGGGVIALQVIPFNGTTAGAAATPVGGLSLISSPTGDSTSNSFVQLIGTYAVPSAGVTSIKLRGRLANVTGAKLWLDDFSIDPPDGGEATLFKSFQTTSSFNYVSCDFRDSGLVRSDPMWADIDPADDTNIPNDLLAPYVQPIPGDIPRGFWADTFATWGDTDTTWGEPHSVVSIGIDGAKVYQGKRTLHFTRDALAGEAGIRMRQNTHYIPDGLVRIGAVFLKNAVNDNNVTVRLRRVSDGNVIYEETLLNTPTGYWYEYQSPFFDIPDSIDQVYSLELTLTGDSADDFYLSNLYSDVANIRYLLLLGDLSGGNPYIDVTDLRYSGAETYVSHTTPVTNMAVQVKILSPEAFALGATLTPNYLRT